MALKRVETLPLAFDLMSERSPEWSNLMPKILEFRQLYHSAMVSLSSENAEVTNNYLQVTV